MINHKIIKSRELEIGQESDGNFLMCLSIFVTNCGREVEVESSPTVQSTQSKAK